jgi:alanyl-tRNA synthetase
MTERLYYADSYRTRFTAAVRKRLTYDGHPAVILDQTAFYPTGGGQPHDAGRLNTIPVLDIISAEKGGEVIHLLAAPLETDSVTGEIDWPRRFDHMQQHTGQHILSQAAIHTLEAATIGFHLSQAYATIDLDRPDLDETALATVESLANQIVYDNREISARFVTEAELATLPLRKPPAVMDRIRIVEIKDFDWSACGGTHVAQTGEIGLIKIIKTERRKSFLRVTFLCGQRAVRHYDQINQQIRDIALQLSVAIDETVEAVSRQSDLLKRMTREKEQLSKSLLIYEADKLIETTRSEEGIRLISRIFQDRELNELRLLAQQLTQTPDCVAFLGLSGDKPQLIFARSANLPFDMSKLLKKVGKSIGGGGGGSPQLAQGGGARPDGLAQALEEAVNHLKNQIRLQAT